MSARYGLVAPNKIIEPYEETLHAKSRPVRQRWASMVWEQLRPHLDPGDRVVVLAGERYREFLVPMIVQHGCEVEVPMEGLGIGRQLQWLSRQLGLSDRDADLERP